MARGKILKLIIGPMFAGKTERLIQTIKVLRRFSKKEVLAFKPSGDTRSPNQYRSHNDEELQAFELPSKQPEKIFNFLYLVTQKRDMKSGVILAFDEVQFFAQTFPKVVDRLLNMGYDILLAGLHTDYLREQFGPTLALVGLCENISQIELCTSICTCGEIAIFSQRIQGGADQVEVGNHYEPRCGKCFDPTSHEQPVSEPLPA